LRTIYGTLRQPYGGRSGKGWSQGPAVEMPRGPRGKSLARSRAVTTEEYERMLAAAVKVRPNDAPEWQRLLAGRGLAGCGWGDVANPELGAGGSVLVDLTDRRAFFRILAEGQKVRL